MGVAERVWTPTGDSPAWVKFRARLAEIEQEKTGASAGETFAKQINAIFQCEIDMAAEQGRVPNFEMGGVS